YLTKIKKFLEEEEGLTTVEYAVAGALVSVAVVTAFTELGDAIILAIDALAAAIA
ncbi:hypothetical protein LCGC14_2735150, partial [marine sediment metagenome]